MRKIVNSLKIIGAYYRDKNCVISSDYNMADVKKNTNKNNLQQLKFSVHDNYKAIESFGTLRLQYPSFINTRPKEWDNEVIVTICNLNYLLLFTPPNHNH